MRAALLLLGVFRSGDACFCVFPRLTRCRPREGAKGRRIGLHSTVRWHYAAGIGGVSNASTSAQLRVL